MNNQTKNFKKLVFLALLLIVIGIAGTAMVGHGSGGGITTLEEVADVTDVNHINIRTENQRVRVRSTTEDQARVVSSGMPTDATLTVEVLDDVLEVEVRMPRHNIRIGINFGDFRSLATPPSLDVYLPLEIYNSIRVTTTNSRIDVSDVTATEIEARTTNGRIEASHLETEEILLETTNARVEVRDVVGDVRVRSSNGRIDFHNPTIAQEVNLQTTNGRIDVNLTEVPEHADFSLSTTNSRTRIFGENRTHQTFGDGTYEVRLQTTNGRITVED